MTASQDTLIGYTIGGRFTIERPVGEDWLGKLYAARGRHGDLVSVKVLHPHLADNQEILARFGQEMLATASIDTPHVIKMLDFGEQRLFHYIVYEYLAGDTVRELLDQGRTFEPARVAAIAAQVCDALTAAHRAHIVHRNLNPSNLLLLRNVLRDDYVKVKDFGMARLRDHDGEGDGLTQVGARVGTAQYMAPEYIDEGIVDPRGDLYALGLVMFEMLTGRPPFEGPAGRVMEAHIQTLAPAVSTLAKVPPWLDQLVARLLTKTPDERPASAHELRHLLELGAKAPLTAPDLVPLGPDGEPEVPRAAEPAARRGGAGGAALAITTIAAVALGGLVIAVLVAVVLVFVL